MLRYQIGGVNRRYGTAGFRLRSLGGVLPLALLARIPRMLVLCGSLLVLSATSCLTLISWRVDTVRQQLEEHQSLRASLREEHVALLSQRAKLSSQDVVLREAAQRLGLQQPQPGQVRRL